MTQIIDFRNAKYHGQTHKGLPHGLGIMIDYKNIFCLGQFEYGNISGKCMIIFGDSKIFYGEIRNQSPVDICTYHLKDKCQVFCNFQQAQRPTVQNGNQAGRNTNKLVALLPTFNMIISVQGESQQQLQIVAEQVYQQNDFHALHDILEQMLNWRFQQYQLEALLSLENFIKVNFSGRPEYQNLLDILYTNSSQGYQEMFIKIKQNIQPASLGIRIQNCMQSATSLTNRHNDGNSYIIKSMGFFTKQGLLEYGLKNIKTLIKGNVKQQAIYNDEKSIIRYEDQSGRPKKCTSNVLNLYKRSLNFENSFIPLRYLSLLQAQCLNINFNIKETQTKKYAQLILQNPKQLTMDQKQKIQEGRMRKLHKGTIQKNAKDLQTTNPYKKNTEEYSKKNQQLQKVRQDIYRSVSKKKINGTGPSPYVHGGTNLSSSPQKQIKASELTNVKPILDIYKNTADKSFYNSINKNDPPSIDKKDHQGYKFSLGRDASRNEQSFVQNMAHNKSKNDFSNTDYFKNLQDRKRLYEQKQKSKSPIGRPRVTDYDQSAQKYTAKKKFSYLPTDQQLNSVNSSNKAGHRNPQQFSYQKNHNFSKSEEPQSYGHSFERSSLSRNGSSYAIQPHPYALQPRQSVYDPHYHYRDNSDPQNAQQNYFKSKRVSPHLSRSPQREDEQSGKLGRRVVRKNGHNQSYNQSPGLITINKKPLSSYDPIVVPQFKLPHTHVVSDYKNTAYDQNSSSSINRPKRDHHLRPSNDNVGTSPLKSEKYRQQYLEQTSPMRKLDKIPPSNRAEKYKYQTDVIMDPGVNFAKQELSNKQRQSRYQQQQYNRNKSPLIKRKKILNQNPFQ